MSPISIAQQSDHRDIPLPLVTSGSENSGNLRELALNRMKDFGAECRDVRFREVGVMHFPIFFGMLPESALHTSQIHEIHHKVRPESIELLRRDYAANSGWETFLSYEDPERDILVGLLRLRKCSEEGTFRPELVRQSGAEGGTSIVRELHVYGTAVPVHGRDPTKFQHQVRKYYFTKTTLLSCIIGVWNPSHGGSRAHSQGGARERQTRCHFR